MRDELTTTALHQREALRFVLSGLFALAALLGCKNRAGPAKQISFDGRGGAVGLWSSQFTNRQRAKPSRRNSKVWEAARQQEHGCRHRRQRRTQKPSTPDNRSIKRNLSIRKSRKPKKRNQPETAMLSPDLSPRHPCSLNLNPNFRRRTKPLSEASIFLASGAYGCLGF